MKKLFLTVLSICTLFAYVPVYADEDPENKEFTKFMDQEFIDTMESDYALFCKTLQIFRNRKTG